MRSDLKKKLDFFTLETSKNHLIRNFLRNGRVRVNVKVSVEKFFSIFTNIFDKKNLKVFFHRIGVRSDKCSTL